MDINQLRENSKRNFENGLIEKIASAIKEGEKRVKGYSNPNAGIFRPLDQIVRLVHLYGGSIKGLKILDLGCGSGDSYAPIVAETLSYMGANVTGIDSPYESHEPRSRGFNYVEFDLDSGLESVTQEEGERLFGNKDVVIAKSLLGSGLCYGRNINPGEFAIKEWEVYKKLIQTVRSYNKGDALYILEVPHGDTLEAIAKKKNLSENERNELIKKEMKGIAKEILIPLEKEHLWFQNHIFTL
jgi:SAM-dependent methyltransferase